MRTKNNSMINKTYYPSSVNWNLHSPDSKYHLDWCNFPISIGWKVEKMI